MKVGDIVEYMGVKGDAPSGLLGTITSVYSDKMFIVRTYASKEYLLEERRLRLWRKEK